MPAVLKRALSAIANRWKAILWALLAILVAIALYLLLVKFPALRAVATAVGEAILFVAASAFLILLLWQFPKWQVRSIAGPEPKERFDRENEARKTLSQIVGGLILLIGFYFTWQNLRATQENLDATKHSQAEAEKATQRNIEIASEGQITDRFTKAIAQLGDTKLEIRLGGIYALERIAKDSPKDHWPIMEVLTAYVREHAKITSEKNPQPKGELAKTQDQPPKPAQDIQAILTVIGRRTLTYGEGEVQDQVLDLHDTNLSGLHLWNADLAMANLSGADLSGTSLPNIGLRSARLDRANLTKAQLPGADLEMAVLTRTNLANARLGFTNLNATILDQANLSGAFLFHADIGGADLRGAMVSGADFNGVVLDGADLRGVDLSETKGLTPAQLESTMGDDSTKLPPGFLRPNFRHHLDPALIKKMPESPLQITEAHCGQNPPENAVQGNQNPPGSPPVQGSCYCHATLQFTDIKDTWDAYGLLWILTYQDGTKSRLPSASEDRSLASPQGVKATAPFQPREIVEEAFGGYGRMDLNGKPLHLTDAQVEVDFVVNTNGIVWGDRKSPGYLRMLANRKAAKEGRPPYWRGEP